MKHQIKNRYSGAVVYECELSEGTTNAMCAGLQAEITSLRAERDVLRAVSDEYDAWIRHHAGGGDYDDFLQQREAIAKARNIS